MTSLPSKHSSRHCRATEERATKEHLERSEFRIIVDSGFQVQLVDEWPTCHKYRRTPEIGEPWNFTLGMGGVADSKIHAPPHKASACKVKAEDVTFNDQWCKQDQILKTKTIIRQTAAYKTKTKTKTEITRPRPKPPEVNKGTWWI